MEVFALRDRLVGDYESYVGSFIKIKDARIEDEVMRSLDEGLLWPDPLIQLNPSFEAGESIDELVDEGHGTHSRTATHRREGATQLGK